MSVPNGPGPSLATRPAVIAAAAGLLGLLAIILATRLSRPTMSAVSPDGRLVTTVIGPSSPAHLLTWIDRKARYARLVVKDRRTRRRASVLTGSASGDPFESQHYHYALLWHPDSRRFIYTQAGGELGYDYDSYGYRIAGDRPVPQQIEPGKWMLEALRPELVSGAPRRLDRAMHMLYPGELPRWAALASRLRTDVSAAQLIDMGLFPPGITLHPKGFRVTLGWTPTALYLHVSMFDEDAAAPSMSDAEGLWLALQVQSGEDGKPKRGPVSMYRFAITGRGARAFSGRGPRALRGPMRNTPGGLDFAISRPLEPALEGGSKRRLTGQTLYSVVLPWRDLGLSAPPQIGRSFGFALTTGNGGPGRATRTWFDDVSRLHSRSALGELLLVGELPRTP